MGSKWNLFLARTRGGSLVLSLSRMWSGKIQVVVAVSLSLKSTIRIGRRRWYEIIMGRRSPPSPSYLPSLRYWRRSFLRSSFVSIVLDLCVSSGAVMARARPNCSSVIPSIIPTNSLTTNCLMCVLSVCLSSSLKFGFRIKLTLSKEQSPLRIEGRIDMSPF